MRAQPILLTSLTLFGGIATARAEAPMPLHWLDGRVYVGLGAVAGRERFGRFNALNEAITPAFGTQLDASPSAIAAGPRGLFGIVLVETRAPALLRRVRADFALEYRTGSARVTAPPYSIPTAFGPSALFAFLSIDGQQGLLFGATPFEDGLARLRLEHRALAGALRLRADLALEPVTVTPFIGLVAEFAQQRYTLDFHLTGPGVAFDYNLDERVRTSRLGGEAGADIALTVGHGITLQGGGAFAYVHQRARFSGSDCFTASTIAAGAPCGGWATSVAFTDARMAWRADLWLGVSVVAPPVRLTLLGLGRYDSAVPGVRNPIATQAIFLGGAQRPGPAALHYSGQWSYGGMLTATVALR